MKQQRNKTKTKTKKIITREQPRKDNNVKRVNFDNVRIDKFEKDVDKQFSRNDGNDVSWYTKNKGLTSGSTMIPFTTVLGGRPPYRPDKAVTAVPGVMALGFTPNFVPDDGFVINQCAQSYYSNVVHANSRNQSYDAADLMIVTLAGAQVFAAIGNLIRAYGVMTTYSSENRYLPGALIQAMGFNFADLQANFSRMLFDINQLIAQSRQIWLPNTFPIINRWFWMNSTVYTDSHSVKPQYYLYQQYRYYKYSGYTDKKGGELVPTNKWFGSNAYGWKTWIDMVQDMINALINDQDRGIMFGDILKCYGSDKIFVLNEIGLDYKTALTYSPEVLWQIENYTIGLNSVYYVDKLKQDTSGFLNQTWGSIVTSASYNDSTMYKPEMGLINFHQAEPPTPEQLLVATRMMSLGNVEVSTNQTAVKANVPSCSGTEIGNGVYIYTYDYSDGFGSIGTLRVFTLRSAESKTSIPTDEVMAYYAFDWAPSRYALTLRSTHNSQLVNYFESDTDYVISEYDNYAYVDSATLKRIHLTAIYSLFDVPML